MANLTAAKASASGRHGLLEILPFRGIASQDFWRGGALVLEQSGANAGFVDRDVDGSEHGIFAGVTARTVKPRDAANAFLSQAVLDADVSLRIPVRRNGSQLFTTSGMTNAHHGRLVFLTDDQTVSLTPPSQDFPLCAGEIVNVKSATEVEVEIAAGIAWRPNWKHLTFAVGAVNATPEGLTDFLFDERVFIREVAFSVADELAGTTPAYDTEIHLGASEVAAAGSVNFQETDSYGVIKIHAVNLIWEPTDLFSIVLAPTVTLTPGRGVLSAAVKYLSLN